MLSLRTTFRLLAFSAFVTFGAGAQPAPTAKYWILLRSKDATSAPALSARALENRQTLRLPLDDSDKPVSAHYVATLAKLGVQPLNRSRWLNGVSARLTAQQRSAVATLPFVAEVRAIDPNIIITGLTSNVATSTTLPGATFSTAPKLVPVLSQVQAQAFAQAGLTGRFVSVGVVDAGFFMADSVGALRPIAQRGGFRAVRDYVNPQKTGGRLFRTLETMSDTHGTEVLAAIAGLDPADNVQYGLGTDATFYLARTDAGNREFRGEEDNWVQAIEWLDSLGVRLVNTSLGYAKGFTNPKENYEPSQMDGKTSLISRAAQMAADKKGMLIIVSAGNEGDDRAWRVISTPADAPGVLAVGATGHRVWERMDYSSIGPDFLPYMKPNVSCFSLYGTSLSAPVITGFAACLLQAKPSLTNKQLISVIERSAHLYPFGNNYVGYGVPQATRALALLKNDTLPATAREVKATGNSVTLPITSAEPVVVLYRKRDTIHVLKQEAQRLAGSKLVVKRTQQEARTTVDLKTEVIEIIWE